MLFVSGGCCIKANGCVAFGIRLRSHTEACFLQTSPSVSCASSFLQNLLQNQDNLASKIVRLLTFATVSSDSFCPQTPKATAVPFLSAPLCSAHTIAYRQQKKRTPMRNASIISCGDRTRTCDLWVMSPTSYHCSTPRSFVSAKVRRISETAKRQPDLQLRKPHCQRPTPVLEMLG